MTNVKLRYNTEVGTGHLRWRILLDGKEHLASEVFIHVPCRTTSDQIEGVGLKHHVSCEAEDITWDGEQIHIGRQK